MKQFILSDCYWNWCFCLRAAGKCDAASSSSQPRQNDVGRHGVEREQSEANSRYQQPDDDDDYDSVDWQNDDIILPPYQPGSAASHTSVQTCCRLLLVVVIASILIHATRFIFFPKDLTNAGQRTPQHHS